MLAGNASSARAGYYRQLTSQPLPDGVYYLGPISSEKLRVLYQHAEAMVFPTLYEGFGLTPLEAMASGTPVIAMPVSSVPEVCGDCALYPDGYSPMALARAMEQMASDEELRGDLQERGRTRVELFRWERTARQTYDSYRRAVLHPSARSLDMRRRLLPAILVLAGCDAASSGLSGSHGTVPDGGIAVAWDQRVVELTELSVQATHRSGDQAPGVPTRTIPP